jgi:hypothetical protein
MGKVPEKDLLVRARAALQVSELQSANTCALIDIAESLRTIASVSEEVNK